MACRGDHCSFMDGRQAVFTLNYAHAHFRAAVRRALPRAGLPRRANPGLLGLLLFRDFLQRGHSASEASILTKLAPACNPARDRLLLQYGRAGAYDRFCSLADLKGQAVEWGSSGHIAHLIATYGLLAIGVIIALESMGFPLPGESVLVLAALYSAHHGHSIAAVVASAAVGAMLGDNVGYWIGREFGYQLLRRYGSRIGLSPNKIKIGQYLFLRHGRMVVFFGRFVAVLRVLAAVLAGINRMDWRQFLLANAAGAILWASVIGFGTYFFGRAVMHVTRPVGIALAAVALAVIVGALLFVRAHEAELEAEAERALPGPLRP